MRTTTYRVQARHLAHGSHLGVGDAGDGLRRRNPPHRRLVAPARDLPPAGTRHRGSHALDSLRDLLSIDRHGSRRSFRAVPIHDSARRDPIGGAHPQSALRSRLLPGPLAGGRRGVVGADIARGQAGLPARSRRSFLAGSTSRGSCCCGSRNGELDRACMRIGMDLGGTKIEAAAFDESGVERYRRRVATPRDDYAGTLDAIAALVEEAERVAGRRGTVGVGTPGAISPASGLLKNANSVWLNGRPLLRDLEARLARPVRLANDANCFALSEALDGAGVGARVVFGVIVGTGTGGGVVVEGRVLTGPNAVAGEWGHNPLPWPHDGEWPGPRCYCGRTGCVETFLSGPGMLRDHEERTGQAIVPAEIARAAGSRGCPGAGESRPLRGSDGPRVGLGDQPPRSRCHRTWAAGCPTSALSTTRFPCGGARMCSRIASTHPCGRRCTATRAACAARRGCGRSTRRRVGKTRERPAGARGSDLDRPRHARRRLRSHRVGAARRRGRDMGLVLRLHRGRARDLQARTHHALESRDSAPPRWPSCRGRAARWRARIGGGSRSWAPCGWPFP